MDTEHGMAVAIYRRQGDRAIFTHTEVPRADEGKGLGSQLVGACRAGRHTTPRTGDRGSMQLCRRFHATSS
jgi:hypothetical protein